MAIRSCWTDRRGSLRLRAGLLLACLPLVGCVSVSTHGGSAGTSPGVPQASPGSAAPSPGSAAPSPGATITAGAATPAPTPLQTPWPTPTWPTSTVSQAPGPTALILPTDAASHTPDPSAAVAPGGDPPDLAMIPGSVRTGHRVTREDGLRVTRIVYATVVSVDRARAHYRAELREQGWRIGEIELDEGVWEIDASKGTREVEIEIDRRRDRTIVIVAVSQP